jgi:hypothetical protein
MGVWAGDIHGQEYKNNDEFIKLVIENVASLSESE